jgi:hypothetical protein
MKLTPSLWRGKVHHQRFQPRPHQFSYPLAMVLFDLDQLKSTIASSRWWSFERFNLISFYRRDYLGRDDADLKSRVSDVIFAKTGQVFSGKVYLLTHPRYLGLIFNPVSFYFCINDAGELQFVLADINNTPWNERHCYVLKAGVDGKIQSRFDKQFHISPFMPMDISYDWQFHVTAEQMQVCMALYRDGSRQFTAAMSMQAEPLSTASMARLPWQFPLQTLRVLMRIYWQALRLWLKRIPFFGHPGDTGTQSGQQTKQCEDKP